MRENFLFLLGAMLLLVCFYLFIFILLLRLFLFYFCCHIFEGINSFSIGMLEIDVTDYRRPRSEGHVVEKKKLKAFLDMWKDFDWTVELEGGDY